MENLNLARKQITNKVAYKKSVNEVPYICLHSRDKFF